MSHIDAPYQVKLDVGGRTLILESGRIAKQANGAVVARYADTVVLCTACMENRANPRDFLPLTVDYREYTYAAGKIPGGFFKREGRLSERETLTSRLIDRPMRPLFPEAWRNETQIVCFVLVGGRERSGRDCGDGRVGCGILFGSSICHADCGGAHWND